jgi:hypothetical protein
MIYLFEYVPRSAASVHRPGPLTVRPAVPGDLR